MIPVLSAVHSVSAIAADFLVASIWQGLIVAAFVAVLLRWVPGLTAARRSAIWTFVLLLVMVFPGLSLAVRGGGLSGAGHAGPLHASLLHATDTWSLALVSVWIVVSLLRISQLVGSAVRLRAIARRAAPVMPGGAVAAVLSASKRRVALCASAEVDRPGVAGFFRPRILLSPGLLTVLSEPELEQVVLHEVEHLRRYDDWINLVQKLSLALFPLHPVLLWLDRQMCRERELACDDSVLLHTRARKAYAACLTRLAESSILRGGFSLALGALGSRERGSELVGRVHRILRPPEQRMSPLKVGLATAAVLAVVSAGAAELARSPQLVSFTPPAPPSGQIHTRLANSSEFGARLQAASFETVARPSFQAAGWQSLAPHSTLLKALLPERRRPYAAAGVATPAPEKGRTRRGHLTPTVTRRDFTRHNRFAPYVALTAWQPMEPNGRATLAVAEDSQIVYAAVPVRDGWLIIQL